MANSPFSYQNNYQNPYPIDDGDNTDRYNTDGYIDNIVNIDNTQLPAPASSPNMSFIPSQNQFVPETLSNSAFMPAFLSKNIGKLMKVEMLLADALETRIGVLMTVGASFIVLKQYQNNNTLLCDIYSIKFVTIIHDNDPRKLIN